MGSREENGMWASTERRWDVFTPQLENSFPLCIGYGQNGKPGQPYQIEVFQRGRLLDFVERHRPRQLPLGAQIDHHQPRVFLLRVGIGVTYRFRQADHGSFFTGMVDEYLVAAPHAAQILKRQIV